MESRIKWVKEGKPRGMQHPSYAEYKRKKRHFRQCQESASEEYMKQTYEDIDNAAGIDIRLFWKLIRRQKPRQSKIYPEIQFADRTGNTPESVASVFAEYFSTIYQTEQNYTFDKRTTTVSSMNTTILNPKRLKILFSVRMTALRKKKFLTLFHY